MPRTDVVRREIAAPPAQVFAALLDPEALTAWLPPSGMTGRFEHFDPRPGGSYRLVLSYADPAQASGKTTAESDVVDARLVAITDGVRVVQAVDFVSDDPDFTGTMTMTWQVHSTSAGTSLEVRADDVPERHLRRGPRDWPGVVAGEPRLVPGAVTEAGAARAAEAMGMQRGAAPVRRRARRPSLRRTPWRAAQVVLSPAPRDSASTARTGAAPRSWTARA